MIKILNFKMPQSCCVVGCRSVAGKAKVKFFCFPSNKDLQAKWVDALCKGNFVPSYHRVCSLHFTLDSFEKTSKLKSTAVPNINTNVLVGRKIRKRLHFEECDHNYFKCEMLNENSENLLKNDLCSSMEEPIDLSTNKMNLDQAEQITTNKSGVQQMKPISDVRVVKTTESAFIKPFSMLFTREGHDFKWDLIDSHNGVYVIIYNKTRNTLVCVRQFRPGVYYKSIPENDRPKEGAIDIKKYPPSMGLTVEFCAGIVDKKNSLEEIAVDEVREECGYEVKISDMQKIISCRSALGSAGSVMTFFYTEVTDQMKISQGGGLELEGEDIEVVEYTIPEIRDIITQSEVLNVSSSFLFGIMWFLTNKIVLST